MTRAVYRTLAGSPTTPAAEIAEQAASYFPDVPTPIFAAAIDRYRNLKLWGSDPVIRREGYDRLHAAMRAFGDLSRTSPSTIASIPASPRRAMTDVLALPRGSGGCSMISDLF